MKTTHEYFEASTEVLKKTDENGYTKEEKLLLDESVNTRFYQNERDAIDGAEWQKRQGYALHCFLKMTDGRISGLFV